MNDSLVSRTFEKLARACDAIALLTPACGRRNRALGRSAIRTISKR